MKARQYKYMNREKSVTRGTQIQLVGIAEHGCGIFTAMSLRQPNNALAIVEANGIHHILTAMKAFPNKVPLQRQGCLALRNIASRLTVETKQVVLDAGAEDVLKLIAARHQESIDEAFAALRDLGVAAVMHTLDAETGKAQGTQVFGSVRSSPVKLPALLRLA